MRLILIYIYLSIISKISQGNQYQKYWDNLLFSPSSLWDSVCFLYLQHASLWGSPMWLVAAVLTCSYKGSLSLVGLTSVHTHPSPPLEMEEEFILWQDTPLSDSGFTPLLVIQAFSSIIPCSSLCCSTYFFPSCSYHSHPWKENFLLSHIDLVSPALYKKPILKDTVLFSPACSLLLSLTLCSLTAAYFRFSTTTAQGPWGPLCHYISSRQFSAVASWPPGSLCYCSSFHLALGLCETTLLIILHPLFTLQPEDSIESKSDHTHCMITFRGITSLLVEFAVKFLQCGRVHGEVPTGLVVFVIQMRCSQAVWLIFMAMAY